MIKETLHVARSFVESFKHLKGMFRTLSTINGAYRVILELWRQPIAVAL